MQYQFGSPIDNIVNNQSVTPSSAYISYKPTPKANQGYLRTLLAQSKQLQRTSQNTLNQDALLAPKNQSSVIISNGRNTLRKIGNHQANVDMIGTGVKSGE